MQGALQINENDATLLSYQSIHKYESAIHHWLIAYKLDPNKLINISFKIISNHLGRLSSQYNKLTSKFTYKRK